MTTNIGVFSAVRPIGISIDKVNSLLDAINFIEPDREDLHCTIVYSRNLNAVSARPSGESVYVATVKGFTYWIGESRIPYLVALLESPSLQKAFKDWVDLGYTVPFDNYCPHITLKSNFNHTAPHSIIALLNKVIEKEPMFLVFGEQTVTPMRENPFNVNNKQEA